MNFLGATAQRNNCSATLMWRAAHLQSGQEEALKQDESDMQTCGQNGSFSG